MKRELHPAYGLLVVFLLFTSCERRTEVVDDSPIEGPSAHFAVFPETLIVDGYTWPRSDGTHNWQLGESVDISLSIFDREGGTLLFSETRPSFLVESEYPDYEFASEVHFEVGGLGEWILPGYFVIMEGAGVTKTHIVENLSLSALNADADLITGTADPDKVIEATVCVTTGCTTVSATVDKEGNWEVDFTGKMDIIPGSEGRVLITETELPGSDGNDRTVIKWTVPEPFIMCWPDGDWLEGKGWPLGSQMTLTVRDDTSTIHTFNGTVITPEWDPVATWVEFFLPFDLDAGDEITLTDGFITKHQIVSKLAVEVVNEEENTIAGTAEPGSQVHFNIHGVAGFDFAILVDETGDGYWIVDFDTDPPLPHDLVPGTGIAIDQFDDDGDTTHIERFVPYPE